MSRRIIGLIAVVALYLGGLVYLSNNQKSSSSSDGATQKMKIRMLADLGGVNDKSFNESTWNGVKQFCTSLGLTIGAGSDCWYAESKQGDASATALQSALETATSEVKNSNGVVIAVGFNFFESVGGVATKNPDVSYIGLDFALPEATRPSNFYAGLFNEAEAGYLAGITAALQSKTNKVGYIGGIPVPAVKNFGAGYVQGVEKIAKEENKKITIDYRYAQTFTETSKCEQIGADQIAKKSDILFAAAGPCGGGAFNATKSSPGSYFVGVDSDQSKTLPGGEAILTSAVKRLDNAVIDMLSKILTQKSVLKANNLYGYPDYSNVAYGDKLVNPNADKATQINERLKKVTSEDVKNIKPATDFGTDYDGDRTDLQVG